MAFHHTIVCLRGGGGGGGSKPNKFQKRGAPPSTPYNVLHREAPPTFFRLQYMKGQGIY